MLHVLLAVLLNAVPIYGVVELGWSAPTVLVLFWCENLFGTLVNVLRIQAHMRLTRRRGHFEQVARRPKSRASSYLRTFLPMTLIFTAAHGVFVGVIVLMMHVNKGGESAIWRFDFDAFKLGLAAMLLVLALDLLIDLPGLSTRSFKWLEQVSGAKIARVLVLHLGIIFGMFAMSQFENPVSFLIVLMGLKALLDALMAWGKNTQPAADKPPAWLKKIAPTGKDGETVEAFWERSTREENARAARNEEIVPR